MFCIWWKNKFYTPLPVTISWHLRRIVFSKCIITLHNVSAVHRGCAVQRGISVHRGDIMINVGEGHWENNWIVWKPQCTEHPLVYSWYPPHSSWYLPVYSWYLPSVLNTPQCTHDIPPVYWKRPWCTQWYPSSVLNTPGVLNDIPPVYWTSPVYLMISLQCP